MAAEYRLPTAVRLQIDEDGVAHEPVSAVTDSLQAQWRRSMWWADYGYANGLVTAFGAESGELVVGDLMLADAYDHTLRLPSGTLWLPSELTPVVANALDTIAIGLFFAATGAAGTEFITFECVQQPETLNPRGVIDGLVAVNVAYRWEIQNDAPADITPGS